MRILQIIHKPQNRGAETFASQLSNHLKMLDHDVKMVAVYNGKADLPYKDDIDSLGASESRRFFDWNAWKKLARIITEFKPDVVQANAGDTLKYAVLSKIMFNWTAPIISRNASEVGRYLRSSLQRHLNSFFYQKIDHVISVSEASQRDILNHFPFLKGKTEVIPVGLEKKASIEPVVLKPAGKKHVVHVGGFSFEKNHQGLLKIFSKVLETKPAVQLHLIGDGPLRGETERRVREMKMSKNIHFYGFRDDPLSHIRGADVLVLPSIIEGLPGVLLEAMYCKIPVIAYDVGGVSEIVTPQTGSLIEKNDEVRFTEAILNALESPNAGQVENAFQMVVRDYMNEEIARKFVKVYDAVMK